MDRISTNTSSFDYSDEAPQRSNFCRHSPSATTSLSHVHKDELFQCLQPVTPSMASLHDRLNSFEKWPREKVRATPYQLADAGFVYIGDRDRLKCFYCNGGLQNWEYNDDPWFEHAKWYPNCEYVLSRKGMSYVETIASRFPNLKRPFSIKSSTSNNQLPGISSQPPLLSSSSYSSASSSGSSYYSSSSGSSHSAFSSGSSCCSSSSSAGMPINYYRQTLTASDEIQHSPSPSSDEDKMRLLKRALNKALSSEIVQEAKNFGFSDVLVQRVVMRKLTANEEYTTVSSLVEDLLNENDQETAESMDVTEMEVDHVDHIPGQLDYFSEARPPTSSQHTMPSHRLSLPKMNYLESDDCSSLDSNKTENIFRQVEDLKNEQTCKVCLDRASNCVFLPCGHLCCCVDCSSALRDCPMCRVKLENILKIYRE